MSVSVQGPAQSVTINMYGSSLATTSDFRAADNSPVVREAYPTRDEAGLARLLRYIIKHFKFTQLVVPGGFPLCSITPGQQLEAAQIKAEIDKYCLLIAPNPRACGVSDKEAPMLKAAYLISNYLNGVFMSVDTENTFASCVAGREELLLELQTAVDQLKRQLGTFSIKRYELQAELGNKQQLLEKEKLRILQAKEVVLVAKEIKSLVKLAKIDIRQTPRLQEFVGSITAIVAARPSGELDLEEDLE